MKKFVIFLLCLIPTLVNASPIISAAEGTFEGGQTIRLSGSGFGYHPDYNPSSPYLMYRFENVEKGVISKTGPNAFNSANAKITTSNQRANSNYCLLHELDVNGNSTTYTNALGETTTRHTRYGLQVDNIGDNNRTYYISGWFYLPAMFEPGFMDSPAGPEQGDAQIKLMGFDPLPGGKTYWQTRNEQTNSPPLRAETEDTQISTNHGPIKNYVPLDGWGRLDIYADPSPTGGFFKFYANGKLVRSGTYAGASKDFFSRAIWAFYFAGYSSINNRWSIKTDDHYLDFTQARVELGNAATWADSNHFEIQLPKAWSATSIEFEFNQGSFSPGDQVFLYIFDEKGVVNQNGFPVTIGGNKPPIPTALSAPKNLRIIN